MAQRAGGFKLNYLEVPKDEEDFRYVKSFTTDQLQQGEGLEFFEEYGFVVVRDVLTAQECEDTVAEMLSFLEKLNPGFDRNNTSTWDKWEGKSYGMPCADPTFTPQILNNRQNPNIHAAFSAIIGTPRLLVNHDRWAIYRPTKIVGDAYKTRDNIHLDINPWRFQSNDQDIWNKSDQMGYSSTRDFITENNWVTPSRGRAVQAILNLKDNEEDDGGFTIVPGFHHQFEEFVRSLPPMTDTECKYAFSDKDPVSKAGVRITCRAGSLVIWDQRCAHGSKCNKSYNMRCVQFMKMFSREGHPQKKLANRKCLLQREIKKAEKEGFVLNPTGRIVFGLE